MVVQNPSVHPCFVIVFLVVAHYSTKFGRICSQFANQKHHRNQKLPHLSIHLIGFFTPFVPSLSPNTHGGPLNKARSFRRFEPKLKVRTPKALKRQNSKGAWIWDPSLGSSFHLQTDVPGGLWPRGFWELLIPTLLKRTAKVAPENILKIGLFAPQRKRLYSKHSFPGANC